MADRKQTIPKKEYNFLIINIGKILEDGRRKAYTTVNSILVKTYWAIGRQIVEYEQKGKERAEYSSALLNNLSRDLKIKYGAGFNIRNIYLMRRFYLLFGKLQTLSAKLSWSHYVELVSIDDNVIDKNKAVAKCDHLENSKYSFTTICVFIKYSAVIGGLCV